MPQRRLLVATALVVLMIALVVLFGRQQRPDSALSGADARWLTGLEQHLGEVRRVRLQSGAVVSTLVREGERWGVEERAGYAVDGSRLGTLLRDLAQARPLEQKTAKPEYFDRLGLADVEKPDSKAVLLELWTTGEAPVHRASHRALVCGVAQRRAGRDWLVRHEWVMAALQHASARGAAAKGCKKSNLSRYPLRSAPRHADGIARALPCHSP